MRPIYKDFEIGETIYDSFNGRDITVLARCNGGKTYLCEVVESDYSDQDYVPLDTVETQMFTREELVRMEAFG